jgi:nicotinamidase-related amidase
MAFDLRPLVVPATTALVTNEVQPGTVSGSEGLGAAGAAVLPNIVRLAAAARAAGVPVFHCVKAIRVDARGRNRNVPLYRMRGEDLFTPRAPDSRLTEGSGVAPELGPEEPDVVLSRLHGMGTASETGLIPLLRNMGVTSVVVTGVSLNVGIPNAVMDLVNQGFDVVVPRDAVAGTPVEYGEQMIAHTLRFLASITTTDEIIGVWGTPSPPTGSG